MADRNAVAGDRPGPQPYEVRIAGHLDSHWAASFDGMTVRNEGDGTTVISGDVVDQAALHGLLKRVRDLGLPLISVMQAEVEPTHLPTDETR